MWLWPRVLKNLAALWKLASGLMVDLPEDDDGMGPAPKVPSVWNAGVVLDRRAKSLCS